MRSTIGRLQYITGQTDRYTLAEQTEMACKAGIRWIQLRIKGYSEEKWLYEAMIAREITNKYNCRLIINDNPYIASKANADGVHLGKNDMDPFQARKILGKEKIIGVTVNSLACISTISNENTDYIGLGPYRFTMTKNDLSPLLGLSGIKNIITTIVQAGIYLPVIVVGGIRLEDLADIASSGAYGIAVSSAIINSSEMNLVAIEWEAAVKNNFNQKN